MGRSSRSVGARAVASDAAIPTRARAVPAIDLDGAVELCDRRTTLGAGLKRSAPALKRLCFLPHHPEAAKRLGRLDELCLRLSPRPSCCGGDRLGPRDQPCNRATVLAGNENLTAPLELRDGVVGGSAVAFTSWPPDVLRGAGPSGQHGRGVRLGA